MQELDDERRRQGILDTLKMILEVETENKNCNCASLAVLKRVEKLLTLKPQKLIVKYGEVIQECKCITYTDKEKIEMSNVIVPVGPNTATVQALDANGVDITGSCTISAVSSDPTQVQIGNPDATTPNVIPFTALVPGGTATITYDVANASGDVQQTDTLTIQITAPASLVITYGTSIPGVAGKKGGAAPKTYGK